MDLRAFKPLVNIIVFASCPRDQRVITMEIKVSFNMSQLHVTRKNPRLIAITES